MPATHGCEQYKVVRKEDSQVRDGAFQIFDGNNTDASSIKVVINDGVVHAWMMLRHGPS
jgi:hypothetical protein